MPGSLSTFYTRVSRAIKRGNVFDADIPGYATDAVRTLENTYNWKHMWVEDEVSLAAAATTRQIELLKTVTFIQRQVGTKWLPLKKVSSNQFLEPGTSADPGGYWLENQTTIKFDSAPAADLPLRYGYWVYTNVDEVQDDLAWLDLDEGLLIAATILEMGPLLKDDKVAARYQPILSAKLEILRVAEVEAEFEGQDQRMVPFQDEMEDYLATGSVWP
jgi:hypothetical protein